ncbi:condensin complex subunit 2-like [Macrosteles quadrilineatus]|uniref:condensin complex subunit 2-like n=1 Tax=Macrosteles quadrilineatus TaxID=74068 RepID=UPI0023E0A790|nr:condensin complex subunit 2-like [Macrosteles quadrilineatus]
MADQRKSIPSYIYQSTKTPDANASLDKRKKKLKFRRTSDDDMHTLSQPRESIAGTELISGKDPEKEGTFGNDQTFIKTMTTEEVTDHIHKCLEMSSENKINTKNAFALQLIDCMKLLLPKEDFSVMACTLDAGQKIYASRVDGLHQQVIKLAEEVINNEKKNKMSEGKMEEDEEALKKGTRKAGKKNVLASAESLRRTLKSNDPKDKFIKFDGLPGAMMKSVKIDPQDLSFTMLKNTPFWPKLENYKPITVNETVSIPHCEIYRNKSESKVKSNLQILSSELDKSELAGGSLVVSGEESEDICDVDMPCDLSSSDTEEKEDTKEIEDEVDIISLALRRLNEEAKENKDICNIPTRQETMKMLFDNISDYHYLNMEKANYWSGHKFWKRSQSTLIDGNEKRKATKKKKEPEPIVYTGPAAEKSISTVLRKGTTLNKKTLMGWKTKNVTHANDLKVNVRTFLDLFSMPEFLELEEDQNSSRSNEREVDGTNSDNNNDTIDDDPMTDSPQSQDRLNSSFYENAPENCASLEEHGDPLNSAFYDAKLTQNMLSQNLSGDDGKIVKVKFACSQTTDESLVPVPNMVKFEPIRYKTKPIRVNMQNLKQNMLTVIKEKEQHNIQDDALENLETQPKVKFSDVLRDLPPRLEEKTAEDLSPGMALLSLLFLANENNLQLKNTNDYSDVEISFEKKNLEDD